MPAAAGPARHDGTGGPHTPTPVIPFRPRPGTSRTERKTPTVPPGSEQPPERRLAEFVERLFLRHGRRTLTDPEAAAVFRITLTAVGHMLQGARTEGVLDAAAHRELSAMIEGLQSAPDIVLND